MLNNEITRTAAPSYKAEIYIGGNYAAAVEACRAYCLKGLCVSVEAADYVYTGGIESGVVVRLINYPRFPKPPAEIEADALALAEYLIRALHQSSASVYTPDNTTWLSRRSSAQ